MTTATTTDSQTATTALCAVRPRVPVDRLVTDLVPPRHFANARFATYRANPAHPSQGRALARLTEIAQEIAAPRRGLFARRKPAPAVYLDGGFGVGKTHLLTSLAHAVGEALGPVHGTSSAAYGTFVEYTNLVGALGFLPTVEALAAKKLVCIDEFELDDAGDTTIMSRLMRELADRGVALAATSNTLPDALGEGRFAAQDFQREIKALSDRFETLRVDGEDYRHRDVVTDSEPLTDGDVAAAAARPGATLDGFDDLLAHLATVHPSRYGALLDGVSVVALTGVHAVTAQEVALRLVVLVDRLYDRDVPVLLGGSGDTRGLFTEEMLAGGYRKKYYRALSRLGALAEEGRKLV
ncbi:cell division protein ZapE [Promicromonospora umidemergens]|uniref:Cell division protein ZapE n=1 Tax=Promicromonospora umidemergens TaxID=629679 RepID=A0ABP8WKC1_9MICO|nr:cell division protein ZapE [Promicromonospora umidemergens]MCP2283876.1 cell division protein ZapE [Promicromonospora umidemergens]